ncbi:GTP-binding protein rhoC-like [Ctenocephalides felis]|uniref:GTP-binding protein rhoC-like n=1 Tax=Ctenocephalides felis TaxID=7515 RepID=UPI000E6E22C1|nr:GTP-binding protein rhoC-like [Ctenocephalides felis]
MHAPGACKKLLTEAPMCVNCKKEHPANYSQCSALLNFIEKKENDTLKRRKVYAPAPTPMPLTRSFSSALNPTNTGPNFKPDYPQLSVPRTSYRPPLQSTLSPAWPSPSPRPAPIRPTPSMVEFTTNQPDPDLNTPEGLFTAMGSENTLPLQMAEEQQKSIGVTAVGDNIVGKTSLLKTYIEGIFPYGFLPTVFEHYTTNVLVDGCTHMLNVWETAGQDDYDRLRPLSYPNTDCFLLCYSIDSRDSLDHVHSKWYPEIRQYSPKAPIIIIATKIDLRKTNTHGLVTFEEGQAMHQKIRSSDFVECSALEYTNVNIVFEKAVRAVLQKENAAGKLKCNFRSKVYVPATIGGTVAPTEPDQESNHREKIHAAEHPKMNDNTDDTGGCTYGDCLMASYEVIK